MQSDITDGNGGLNNLFGTVTGLAPFASGFRTACQNIAMPISVEDPNTYFLVAGLPISLGSFNPFSALSGIEICVALVPCGQSEQYNAMIWLSIKSYDKMLDVFVQLFTYSDVQVLMGLSGLDLTLPLPFGASVLVTPTFFGFSRHASLSASTSQKVKSS